MIRNIIFDLDGTLIDSAKDIINCLKKSFEENNIKYNIQNERILIGPSLNDMIDIVSPNLSNHQKEKLVNKFKEIYDNSDYKNTNLMIGVRELLDELKEMKIKIYIATNKRLVPTKRILKKLSIENYFERVFTIDFNNGKLMGKTEVIKYIINKLKLKKDQTIYVGDTESDIIAASKNGLKPIIFLNGYGKKEDIFKSKPTHTINEILDLTAIVNTINE